MPDWRDAIEDLIPVVDVALMDDKKMYELVKRAATGKLSPDQTGRQLLIAIRFMAEFHRNLGILAAQVQASREAAPRVHTLKVWPEFFSALVDRTKTFEVRKNDRDFQPGDILEFREFDPLGRERYGGRFLHLAISYILHGGRLGIEAGYVVLGLRELMCEGTAALKPEQVSP